jgi:CubicO group peptidase (beta-lactamase class C family)
MIVDAVERAVADAAFSGAVRVEVDGDAVLDAAYGLADRAHGVVNTTTTRFGMASGSKTLTAVTVISLVADGVLELSTPARALLRGDLPLVGDDVTVEHLLAHRSGIGDYIDEDAGGSITDHVIDVPVHRLQGPEDFLPALDGHPAKFPAGTSFSYCNSGYVLLALLAERATGTPFPDLVRARACRPAGLVATDFIRTDELPGDVAVGYLAADGLRTNALHLPVVPSGDGGMVTTTAEVHRFWAALHDGAIVPPPWVEAMLRPRSEAVEGPLGYGLGIWLHPGGVPARLEGYDAGVSFRSEHDPIRRTTWTVVANWSDGAWPVVEALAATLNG